MTDNQILISISKIQQNPEAKKMNLGCGQDIRPSQDGWFNVDSIVDPEIHKTDIFDIPWDLNSNSFDYILARHVLEHVPHNIDKYNYEKNFMQLFMEEIWRVMKPGSILDIEVPGGLSSIARAINHKRIITPKTFHIFYPDDKWGYYSKCRFEIIYVSPEPLKFKFGKFLFQKLFGIDITYLRSSNIRFCLRKLS
ncbi:MAG: class I SAM-dependent methyltransferase [Dolichospermum sp.]